MNQKAKAHSLVYKATRHSILVKDDTCELCNKINPGNMVYHHYNGYEEKHIYDVWCICRCCNAKLRTCHDGALTKEDAINFVTNYLSTGEVAQKLGCYSDEVLNLIKENIFPNANKISNIIGGPTQKREWWLIPAEDVRQYLETLGTSGDYMTDHIERRGGKRTPSGGRPTGSTKPQAEKAKSITVRLYENERDALELLVKTGYADNKTAAIRKAIMEALGSPESGKSQP